MTVGTHTNRMGGPHLGKRVAAAVHQPVGGYLSYQLLSDSQLLWNKGKWVLFDRNAPLHQVHVITKILT